MSVGASSLDSVLQDSLTGGATASEMDTKGEIEKETTKVSGSLKPVPFKEEDREEGEGDLRLRTCATNLAGNLQEINKQLKSFGQQLEGSKNDLKLVKDEIKPQLEETREQLEMKIAPSQSEIKLQVEGIGKKCEEPSVLRTEIESMTRYVKS